MYLTNTPNLVYRDLQDGKPWEPIKSQIRLLLNEIISGVDAAVNPTAATLDRKLFTSAGNFVVDAADFNQMHSAFTTGDVTWNLSGIAVYKPYYFMAEYNSGVVILDAGPGYYWRNVNPRDGAVETTKNAIRLRPGDVAVVYRFTTNDYRIIGGYSRPSYTLLSDGVNGFFARGPNGLWHGSWRRTLAAGDNVLTFSTAYGGAPSFTGAATRFTGFAPIASTGIAPQISQKGTGAGTITLHNAGSSIDGMVNFVNLAE